MKTLQVLSVVCVIASMVMLTGCEQAADNSNSEDKPVYEDWGWWEDTTEPSAPVVTQVDKEAVSSFTLSSRQLSLPEVPDLLIEKLEWPDRQVLMITSSLITPPTSQEEAQVSYYQLEPGLMIEVIDSEYGFYEAHKDQMTAVNFGSNTYWAMDDSGLIPQTLYYMFLANDTVVVTAKNYPVVMTDKALEEQVNQAFSQVLGSLAVQ